MRWLAYPVTPCICQWYVVAVRPRCACSVTVGHRVSDRKKDAVVSVGYCRGAGEACNGMHAPCTGMPWLRAQNFYALCMRTNLQANAVALVVYAMSLARQGHCVELL